MKRIVVVLLCAFLLTSAILTGCGAKENNEVNEEKTVVENTTNEKTVEETSIVTEPGTFPITKEEASLKLLVVQNAYVQDYTTNDFTKYYEEKTNVKIEWDILSGSGDEVLQKVSMILASGDDYPDIMIQNLTKAQAVVYGAQGILLPLNDLIDKYSVHLKKVLEEDEHVKKSLIYKDGNMYFFPKISYVYHGSMPNKMWVYQPWLDKLGLKAPTTTDEFYQMLKAFKEKDPNGNGKADEIPMASLAFNNHTGMINYLMSAFTYPNFYYVENDKVVCSAETPEFKEGLKYIKKLYDEGLIAKDSITMDRKQRTALAENADVAILGAAPALWYGMFTTNNGESGRYNEYNSIAPLKGPAGVQMAAETKTDVGLLAVITKGCKNPEIAMRWIDWFYSMEGNLSGQWGLENVGWRRATADEKGIDGQPGVYTVLEQAYGENQNVHWSALLQSYESQQERLGIVATNPEDTEPRLYRETQKYEPYKVNKTLPYLYMSEEETQEQVQLDVLIDKAYMEGLAKVIATGKDIDAEWDAVMEGINNVGLDKALALRQKAYDEYLQSTK